MRGGAWTTLLFWFLTGAAQAAREPSSVIFPDQKLPLTFSHKQHLKFKLQCDFCHDKAEASTAAADNLLPTEEACRTCHKIDRAKPEKDAIPAARCDACHKGPDASKPPPVDVPAPNIKFNHKVHVDRQIQCTRCHGGMDRIELATRAQLPRMPLCLGCHDSTVRARKNPKGWTAQRAPAKCSTCHLTEFDDTLRTHFPSGTLAPSGTLKGDAHTIGFATNHAQVAALDAAYCENCHRQDFCLSCHNAVVKPMTIHGNDYLSIHAIEARKERLRCQGCHRLQTFCLGCHERAGLTDPFVDDASNSLAGSRRRFHPPYELWVMGPRTPDHHSWQAERNLNQCVACHREDTCLECHSSVGVSRVGKAISPHPAAFAGSHACQALASRNGRVCLKCHAPTDAHLACR